MHKTSTRLALIAACTLLLSTATPSQACDGYCGGGMGFGWDIGRLYNSLENRVPYFAAHPPVYYSYPVPRTYGHSPFAYPPHFRTPDVVESAEPVTIVNPYVPESEQMESEEESKETVVSNSQRSRQVEPLVIENPYVPATKLVKSRR